MRAEDLDEIVAEQAAQQQIVLMTLRRIAALTKKFGQDTAEIREFWKLDGNEALERAVFIIAPGREDIVRSMAKARLAELIDLGLQ